MGSKHWIPTTFVWINWTNFCGHFECFPTQREEHQKCGWRWHPWRMSGCIGTRLWQSFPLFSHIVLLPLQTTNIWIQNNTSQFLSRFAAIELSFAPKVFAFTTPSVSEIWSSVSVSVQWRGVSSLIFFLNFNVFSLIGLPREF